MKAVDAVIFKPEGKLKIFLKGKPYRLECDAKRSRSVFLTGCYNIYLFILKDYTSLGGGKVKAGESIWIHQKLWVTFFFINEKL